MKKAFLVMLCLVACICFLTPKAEATSGTYCGLNWEFDEATGTLTITGQGAMSEIEYPPWLKLADKCTTAVVGEGVTALGGRAFQQFEKLTSVSLPATLTAIYGYAFEGCTSLSKIQIPKGVNYIGANCFSRCSALTEINIPSGVTEIKGFTFVECTNLRKVTLPSTLQTIGMEAFRGCWMLSEVTLPDSVTYLGSGAFSGCASLQRVSLSKNLEYMGNNVFMECISLGSVVIPDKVEKLDHYAFYGCISLTDVTIGAGVNTIDPNIFFGCYGLEILKVSEKSPYFISRDGVIYTADKKTLILAKPNISGSYTVLSGTQNIGPESFCQCILLTDVILPDSVTEIGDNAFDKCLSLKTVKFGSKLQYVRQAAFANTALTSVTLPASVKLLDDVAFGGCYVLKEIRFLGKKPGTVSGSAFAYVTATAYYKPDKSWEDRKNYGGDLTWVAVDCNGAHTAVTRPGTAPTCTADGLTEGSYCSVCGQELKTQTVIAASHSYGSWTVITPATTQTEGKSQRTCSVCNKTEEKTVPKLTPAATEDTTPEETLPSAPSEVTVPETEATEPAGTEATAPASQTQDTQKKIPTKWIILPIVAIVVIADVAAVLLYLKKRKK